MKKKSLLILGHGRHGKDTVAEIIADRCGYAYVPTSLLMAKEIIMPAIEAGETRYAIDLQGRYKTAEECYADRSNHRFFWHDMVRKYNNDRNDDAAFAKYVLKSGSDIYSGMRSQSEVDKCIHDHLFDHIIWVDRSKIVPLESSKSCTIVYNDSYYTIDNNGDRQDFMIEVSTAIKALDL